MGTEFKHPADEIARALSRANGILTVIGGCYDKNTGEFAIGTTYVADSIIAVDGLLAAATEALSKLYESCDLSIVRDAAPVTVAAPAPVVDRVQAEAPQMASAMQAEHKVFSTKPNARSISAAGGYLAAFGPGEPATSLAERVESVIPSKSLASGKREVILEQPATTYEELLAKVTAVADQAAFQAHSSPQERSLLPALEGLRADLMKMRNVA